METIQISAKDELLDFLFSEDKENDDSTIYEQYDIIEEEKELESDHDNFFKDLLQKGTNINEYLGNLEKDLEKVEESHVQDCIFTNLIKDIKQLKPLTGLHENILACDNLLGNMESLLSGFQTDLEKLSQEIQTLQEQSLDMSIRLKNRLTVKQQLAVILDGILITPEIIQAILDSDINDSFCETLLDLNKKMNFVKTHQGKHIKAFRDIGPELERLRIKATEKIRLFLLEKTKTLLNANANIPVIQQSVLLKYKNIHHFVVQRHGEAATELKLNYIYIMQGYYSMKFNKYISRVHRLQNVIADKSDLIGLDDSAKKGLFNAGKMAIKDKASVFTLGDRVNVLFNIDSPVILPHVAEEQQQKFPFEVVFRSITRTLMDNASSEYCFITDFFMLPKMKKSESNQSTINEIFNEVFEKTFKLIQDSIRTTVENNFDAVSILLCIRINTQHQLIMQKRRIPALDNFLNAIHLLLWPRFQVIMDMHISSVQKAISGGGFFGSIDILPHYVTRRYAEFSSSILTLNDGYQDHLLEGSLSRLRLEVEGFIGRMGADFTDRKKKIIFLINNYDLIISILEKNDSPSISKERSYFITLLDNRISEFVEEGMMKIGGLINFIKETDSIKDNLDTVEASRFEKIAKDFAGVWKNALADINALATQSFSNFKNGTMVTNAIFKQFLFYYQSFLNLWEKKFSSGVKASMQPIALQQVVDEIKTKYNTNF